jgi:hypothetical protein
MSDPFPGVSEADIPRKLDQILEEVAGYAVDIEPDPTQPHLGYRYLQKVLSDCRNFTNRVTFYLQAVMRLDKALKSEIRYAELNFDLNVKSLLADDVQVRQEPSIEDRRAAATIKLKPDAEALDALRVRQTDVEETIKILKMKHQELLRTSQDIKLQRVIVKDDKETILKGGGDGYSPPQKNQDRSVPDGMPAPVTADDLAPKGILPEGSVPEPHPDALGPEHARQIHEFLAQPAVRRTLCAECAEPQLPTPSGLVCKNGHGGADSLEPGDPALQPEPGPSADLGPEPAIVRGLSQEDLLD